MVCWQKRYIPTAVSMLANRDIISFSAMTKVFLIACSYPDESGSLGGVFIHNQAVALKKCGYDVSVLYYDFRSIRRKRKFGLSCYRLDGIDVFRYAFPCGPIQPLFSFLGKAFGYKLFKYASKIKGKPDLFHAHFVDAAKIALRLSRRTGIGYFMTEHSSSVIQERLTSKEKKDSALVYQNAKCVIAVSEKLEDSVRRITDCKTKVVPNIIPQYFFDQPIKDCFNKKVSDFVFISVGFFNQRKRFDLVLRAFQKVSRQRENVYLEIAGSGSLENYLKELTASLGVSEKVRFLGAIPNRDLTSLYSSADCFVLVSDF